MRMTIALDPDVTLLIRRVSERGAEPCGS
jgi:hypothetical protein